MIRGRIEKALSGFYYVNTGAETLQCRARGKFRREGMSPLVGDWVQVRELGGGEGFVDPGIRRHTGDGAVSHRPHQRHCRPEGLPGAAVPE